MAVLPDAVQNVLKESLATVHAGYPEDDEFNLYPDDESCPCVFACSRPRLREEDVPNNEELLRLLLLLLLQ